MDRQGFWKPLASNHTYTPNQFFDVVLPQANLTIARIVGFMIRQTIGWTNKHNQPRRRQLEFTQVELSQALNLHQNSINNNVRRATQSNFFECVRKGTGDRKGSRACPSIYQLKWSEGTGYTTDPQRFVGFLAGQGNRTVVPNQFFDEILLTESLAVIKIVGLIIRKTIGWVDNFGNRKIQEAVSYTQFARSMRMSSYSIAQGLKASLSNGYIRLAEKGQLKRPSFGGNSASYELFWTISDHALSTDPQVASAESTTQIRAMWALTHHRNQSDDRPQTSGRSDHKNQSDSTTKTRAKTRHKNQSYKTINNKQTGNKLFKQQQRLLLQNQNQELINQLKKFIPALQNDTIQDLLTSFGPKRVAAELDLMQCGYRTYQDRAKFLIAALKNNYAPPDNYLARSEPFPAPLGHRLEQQYHHYTERLLAEAETSLKPQQRAELLSRAKDQLFTQNPKARDYAAHHLDVLIRLTLRSELQRDLQVPSFEEWSAQRNSAEATPKAVEK